MKLKAYKAITLIAACLAGNIVIGQTTVNTVALADSSAQTVTSVQINTEPVELTNAGSLVNVKNFKVQLNKLKTQLQKISVQTNVQVISALNNINVDADVDAVAPQINSIIRNATVSVNSDKYDDAEAVKTYAKTYSADANDVLSIENKYGNVTVNTWNRNEFKVEVQIKVSAGSDDQAKKILDNVRISDAKNGSTVAFRTIIEEVKSSWFSSLTGSGAKKMEINYTVYMPVKNDFVVDDRYGAIILPDLMGKVTINSAYGSLSAKSLTNESVIRVKYGNAVIENLGNCTLDLGYGDLNLGSVNSLTADVGYSPVKISKLHSAGTVNIKYGSLQIGDLDKNVKNLAINASYTNVDIGLSGDENATLSVVTHYADFGYGNNPVTITSKTGDDERGFHPTKSYKGYIGKGNNDKNITISSNYGNVKFN
ncbi:hypothetical protein [Mucilaginibacter sp.]